jgi:glutathionyl-hydroquinone reductase
MFGVEGNEAFAEKHIKTLTAKMDGYERILSKQKYLAGDVSTYRVLVPL